MTIIETIVNVSKVPQRSPFRYPGGKTWLVPQFRQWLNELPLRPHILVEPFAGGAIISLTAVMENLVDQAVMGEINKGVAAVWRELIDLDGGDLAERILSFNLNRETAQRVLNLTPDSNLDLAFQTILKNRVQRGGIMSRGASFVRNGENGRGILSRWYPQTLAKRIREIALHRDRITFYEVDAFDLIPEFLSDPGAVFFIDPPYTAGGKKAGKRLYDINEVDHKRLFEMMSQIKGRVLMTYDDSVEVLTLARQYGFQVNRVPMKNTHNEKMFELLLTR